MIEVRELSKWFPAAGGPKLAVDAVRFTVRPGEVFGLLGPNGPGKTILFSTHIMREAERLCDRVAVMARGKVVACGTLDDLREMYKQDDLEELFFALVS